MDKDLLMDIDRQTLEQLLHKYSSLVKSALNHCEVSPCISKLRDLYHDKSWCIVSGGDQNELRELFLHRGLSHYFNGGIFGSPDDKKAILQREINNHNIIFPAIFFGDSRYDYLSSLAFNIDFVFVSQWTELLDWKQFVHDHQIPVIHSLNSLLVGLQFDE